MITEDYVSFETAKLLKEKGFDEPTTKSYYTEGFENPMKFSHDLLPCIKPDEFLCPTLQMAMKWLRKEHNIFIGITSCTYPTKKKVTWTPEISTFDSIFLDSAIEYDRYEEAAESAIKYCLENLI